MFSIFQIFLERDKRNIMSHDVAVSFNIKEHTRARAAQPKKKKKKYKNSG